MPHSSQFFRWRSCEIKHRYETQECAEAIKQHRIASSGISWAHVSPYHCEFCTGWHLGHQRHTEAR